MAKGSIELDVAGHIVCLQRESQTIIEAFQRQQVKNEVDCISLCVSYKSLSCSRRTSILTSGSTSY
jgi:hypothetical protein